MRENGPFLSRVVDPPKTKSGPRAGNFPGPPKNTFVPGGATTRDKRPFSPGSWLHPGQKGGPLYMSLLPPPSSNTWSVLDLRLARAAAVPCAHRLLLAAVVVPERRRPPPPEDAPTELRRPTAPSVPSSAIPERRPELCRPRAPPHCAVVPDLRRPEPPPRVQTSSLIPARTCSPPPRRLFRHRPRPPPRPCAAMSSPSRPRPELH